jgi:hypothetical protein
MDFGKFALCPAAGPIHRTPSSYAHYPIGATFYQHEFVARSLPPVA